MWTKIYMTSNFELNSAKIPWKTSVKHLSNYPNHDLNDNIDIRKKQGDIQHDIIQKGFILVRKYITILKSQIEKFFSCL